MAMADQEHDETRCPVCDQAAADWSRCPECGWTLRTPWRAGRLTPAAQTGFQARLNAKRLEYDARIVARIADQPGPYVTCIRGGPPTAREWAAARRAAAADEAGAVGEGTLRTKVRALLTGLPPDTETTVIEVGPDGIAVVRLRLDQHGTPSVSRDGDIVDWSSLIPGLPASAPERRFRLAAGAVLARPDGQPGDPLVTIPRPGSRALIICRPAGWAVLEQTAALLAARSGQTRLRVIATPDAEPVFAMLTEFAAQAPLSRAYQLLVAGIDNESGTVRTSTRELFAPGNLPGAQAWLPLRRLPGDHSDIILAIFANGANGTDEPVALFSAPLPAGVAFQLHITLAGPGRVVIDQPKDVTEHDMPWSRLRASVPDRVDVTIAPIDLVCAIDMTGTEERVASRRRLVTDLLDQLGTEYPDPDQLRVAVLTCRDHDYGPREHDDVISACGFRPPGEAAAWLAARPAAEERYVPAAPLEDLLAAACRLLEHSRRRNRAARVLTVAGKQPHLARKDPYDPSTMQLLHPCPHGADWRASIAQLTRKAGARCVLVSDAVAGPRMAPAVWRQLGPHGVHVLADTAPRELGEDLGLLIRPEQRIPVPVLDWK